jgi:hypothetical protein
MENVKVTKTHKDGVTNTFEKPDGYVVADNSMPLQQCPFEVLGEDEHPSPSEFISLLSTERPDARPSWIKVGPASMWQRHGSYRNREDTPEDASDR